MTSSAMTLPLPNVLTVKNCRQFIKYYANINLKLIHIAALHNDLSALAANLSTVDQNANDILLKVNNVMNITDIKAALEDLEELTGSVLDDYKKDLGVTLATKKKTLADLRDELYKPTFNLKSMNFTSNTYRLQELTTTRANLQAISTLEKDEDYYDVLLKKKQALDVAIEAYEAESFYDKTLPILNQVEKVVTASESPATFKKELVKEGVETAKTILKLADAAIKHDDMVKARIEIIIKINERNARNNDIDRQLKSNFDETTQIVNFEKLRTPKAEYVIEVEKIIDSFNTFITVVFAGADTQEIAKRFVENSPTLKAYANSLSPVWLRG
jgi:hypothetical protein